MYEDSTVGVVVPAYNEEGHVGEVIDTIPDFVDRVYVVDDASTDDTWAEVQRHATEANGKAVANDTIDGGFRPRVVTIRHERNRGVGAAVKTGYRKSLQDGIDVTAVMDGDGQMDPDILDRFVEPIVRGDVDYVKGARLHRRGHRAEMSRWRSFGNWLLTMLTRASSGYWGMTDPQNGYRAISHRALAVVPFEEGYDGHGFTNEMLALLNVHDFRIADVSHAAYYGDETSDIQYKSFVPVLSWLIVRRFLWRLKTSYFVRSFHPVIACYPIGIVASVVGLLSVGYALVWYDGTAFLGGLVALSVVLLGSLMLTLALWFDVAANDELVLKVEPEELSYGSTGVSEQSAEVENDVSDQQRTPQPRQSGGAVGERSFEQGAEKESW